MRLEEMKKMYPKLPSLSGKVEGSSLTTAPLVYGRKLGKPVGSPTRKGTTFDPKKKVRCLYAVLGVAMPLRYPRGTVVMIPFSRCAFRFLLVIGSLLVSDVRHGHVQISLENAVDGGAPHLGHGRWQQCGADSKRPAAAGYAPHGGKRAPVEKLRRSELVL